MQGEKQIGRKMEIYKERNPFMSLQRGLKYTPGKRAIYRERERDKESEK